MADCKGVDVLEGTRTHGKASTYKYGCRCAECKMAHRDKCREYRATMLAKHGVIPSQHSRKSRPRKNWQCAICGKAIRSNAGGAKDGRILCKAHNVFERKRSNRRARSQRKLNQAAKGSSGKTLWISKVCKVCTNPFITCSPASTCCTDPCTAINKDDYLQAKRQRRRARKRNAYRLNVSPRRVFEHDGYRCHLCKRKCDRTKQVPHPKAPTIDHVIPLAQGGTHEPLNCRTACFRCNAQKSNIGSGDQMLLLAL